MGAYRRWRCSHCKKVLDGEYCYKPRVVCSCTAHHCWVAIRPSRSKKVK